MAKTTSSKAKTKTVKKTPTKANTTKKSTSTNTKVAAKTATASVTKKVVSKEAAKPVTAKAVGSATKKPSFLRRVRSAGTSASGLKKLSVISVIVFVGLAAAVSMLMQVTPYDISIAHLTSDALLSQTQTVFVPAQKVLFSVDLRWVATGTLLLSALLLAVRVARREVVQASPVRPWRAVDVALTGALLVEIVGILSGVQEILALKALGLLVVGTAVFAWIAGRENFGAAKFVKGAFWASIGSAVAAALLLGGVTIATLVYGLIRSPWYTYALIGVLTLTLLLALVGTWKALHHTKKWAQPLFVERNYLLLNLFAKAAFAVILLIGLRG